MNLAKFLVLGSLEALEEGSGYDITTYLEEKQIDKWTDIKKGSIYFALKKLVGEGKVEEVRQEQAGAYPVKSIYKITEKGTAAFDDLQMEAFSGLYPKFYGFKLALKFNKRKTETEIINYASKGIRDIERTLQQMNLYMEMHPNDLDDIFFIRNDEYLYEAEKRWLMEVIQRYSNR